MLRQEGECVSLGVAFTVRPHYSTLCPSQYLTGFESSTVNTH